MTDEYGTDDEQDELPDTPEQMTEQIEASFGPMSVYVSGTEQQDVRETFEQVWETVMETYDRTHEFKKELDDDSEDPTKSFSD